MSINVIVYHRLDLNVLAIVGVECLNFISRMMNPYRLELMRYMASPIYVVRRLTALSLVAAVDTESELCSLVTDVSQSMFVETSANTLHCSLLTLQEMVKQLSSSSRR